MNYQLVGTNDKESNDIQMKIGRISQRNWCVCMSFYDLFASYLVQCQ
jgi:hypothetical protein